ncbi:MAG: peptidase T [Thermoanaerobaculum sp.]|nr:peptidase T [Thermoanaerobaculum sp.]
MVLELDAQDRHDLLQRFLRYVQVDTQSDENSSSFPSTEKQKELSRLLVEELKDLGLPDVVMDQWGYVYATLPGNIPEGHPAAGKVPTIGLIAHLDTYFATPGTGVKPQVIHNYPGGDISLPGDPSQVIRFAENPNLARCVGHTIITSDGTTLLGADDKAGIAEIMTALAWMQRHPEFLHGPVRVAFTPDEEVGRGTEHFDVEGFGTRYAYTLDGSDLGEIEDETFCADSALVTVEGYDVHPGYAKGKMTNAVRVAAFIVQNLPQEFLPETTEGRQPYLHPYDLRGDVSKVELKFLVRAFTEEELHQQEATLQRLLEQARQQFPGAKITVTVKESYRNMAYAIRQDPQVLDVALEAVRRMGLEPVRKAIRGGTDGARLSFMGILTPNVWAGGQNFHSVQEWVSLEWMVKATECTLHILSLWVERATGA